MTSMDDQIRQATSAVMIAVFGWLLLRAAISKPRHAQRAVYGWSAAITILAATIITLKG